MPSYDPQVTGLLTYNQLVLQQGHAVEGDIVRLLVKSRVLSLLQFVGTATRDQLRRELAAKVGAVGSRRADADGDLDGLVGEVCNQLVKEQLVTASADGTTFRLASVGSALVAEQASRAELLRQQFDQSISDRVWAACGEDGARAKRVTPAALAFIAACLERRALGVALSWSAPKTDFRDYHIVALIQSLPEFMGQLSEPADALVLVRVVQELLASPTDGESQYIGLALQAQFGVHLLGYDPDTLAARAEALKRTLFLIDSSTLIPAIARSGPGHTAARSLIVDLQHLGASTATTQLLAVEVAEHARFVLLRLAENTHGLSAPLLAMAAGKAGVRTNVLLEGFLKEVEAGVALPDFRAYLNDITGIRGAGTGDDEPFVGDRTAWRARDKSSFLERLRR